MRRFIKREREKWQVGWRMRWAFGGPERPPEEYFGGRDPHQEYFGWREPGVEYFGWREPYPPPRYFGWQDTMRIPFGARPQFPPVDLYEEEGKLILVADIPGFDKEEIKVKVKPKEVEIYGNRKERVSGLSEEGVYRFERYFDEFSRVIPLPFEVNPDTARGKYENGTLTVVMEKAQEEGKEVPLE